MSKAIVSVKLNKDYPEVHLRVSKKADLSDPIYSEMYATTNTIAKITIDELEPDTQYYYGVLIHGTLQNQGRGKFKTFPDRAKSFTCAFSSCAKTGNNNTVFDDIRNLDPLFFIHMGDLHYADITSNNISLYRNAYDAVFNASRQRALYANVPTMYTWDDHDFSNNNSDGTTSHATPAAQAAYKERVPHYPLNANDGGIGQSWVVGRVRFIMPDLMSYKSYEGDADNSRKTQFGANQLQWFYNELLKPEPVKIWVNCKPWNGAAEIPADDWAGYTTERRAISNFIKNNDLEGHVMILSGDMHGIGIDDGRNSDFATGGGARIPIFQAAPLSSSASVKGGGFSHGTYTNGTAGNQYGVMNIIDNGTEEDIVVEWLGKRNTTTVVSLRMNVPSAPYGDIIIEPDPIPEPTTPDPEPTEPEPTDPPEQTVPPNTDEEGEGEMAGYTSVKKFGAIGDGLKDDTQSIQNTVNSLTDGGTLYFPKGKYKISKRGTFSYSFSSSLRSYAILIENKKNIRVIFDKDALVVMDAGAFGSNYNGFVVKNCSNVDMLDVRGEGSRVPEKDLYDGALISITDSTNVLVDRANSFNLAHGVIAGKSNLVRIMNSLSHKKGGTSGAHFGVYASNDCLVSNNYCFGGTTDGDIGIFGSPSFRNTVENNFCYNHALDDANRTVGFTSAQGIYIDSGTKASIIRGNNLYGYYYGIDAKTDIDQTLVQGNIIEKCMVAITGRRGEGNYSMNNLLIKDNIIKPNGGNGRTGFNHDGITVPMGIWLQDCFGATVDGNMFGNDFKSSNKDFVGIYVKLTQAYGDDHQGVTNIVNNMFALENRIEGSAGGHSLERSIVLSSGTSTVSDINIANNTFDGVAGGNYSKGFIEANNVSNLKIDSNIFNEIKGAYCIKLTNCHGVSINSNSWKQHQGLVQAINSSGVSFIGNNHFEGTGGATKATLSFRDTQVINITSNTSRLRATAPADGLYFEMLGASDWIVAVGNMLDLYNRTSANWYLLAGTNNAIANNLIK